MNRWPPIGWQGSEFLSFLTGQRTSRCNRASNMDEHAQTKYIIV